MRWFTAALLLLVPALVRAQADVSSLSAYAGQRLTAIDSDGNAVTKA